MKPEEYSSEKIEAIPAEKSEEETQASKIASKEDTQTSAPSTSLLQTSIKSFKNRQKGKGKESKLPLVPAVNERESKSQRISEGIENIQSKKHLIPFSN